MPSQEVLDAIGEAPPRSAADVLKVKRQALAKAKQRYAEAREARDEDAMAECSRKVSALVVLITELEQEAAEEREQGARAAAEQRRVGISKAVGSVLSEYLEDAALVVEAAQAYAKAVDRINERYRRYEGLLAEDAALRDRFGIEGAKTSFVFAPHEHPVVVEAARTLDRVSYARMTLRAPDIEKCEHGLRDRRTYAEVVGTPTADIITSAGLRPWRPLSEREQEAVAAVASEKEANVKALGELEVEAAIASASAAHGLPVVRG